MPKKFQIVRGTFSTDIKWRVPEGIDLKDKETYEYEDKYGTLWIRNKNTGEEYEIESYAETEHDYKRTDCSCVTDSEEEE